VSVALTTDGAVAIVTLDRPDKLNAIDGTTTSAMAEAVQRIERDDDIRVAVLTGAGDRAFSAGADLKAAHDGAMLVHPEHGFGGFVAHARTKPWIAAVNGIAVGGGLEFALACDVIIAADTARFGFPEVTIGAIAGAGGLFRLSRAVGYYQAMELLLGGELIDAPRASEIGLLNRVVSSAELVPTALALAQRIAQNAPLSVVLTRRAVLETWGVADDAAWTLSGDASDVVLASEDSEEGARAFIEKRPPQWVGR
jgi:crotonobetainyl-CoA hydratase